MTNDQCQHDSSISHWSLVISHFIHVSQLTDLIRQAQTGSEMSLESLRPSTLYFGTTPILGTGGSLSKELDPQPDGTLFEMHTRNFRVRLELLVAAGITIIEKKTSFVCDGVTYRIDKTDSNLTVDPCLLLKCKQL